jgi:hypothetical protein
VLNCLKKHAKYFKHNCREQIEEIEAQDRPGITQSYNDEMKRQLKRVYVSRFPVKGTIQPINTILLRNCIFFA